MPASTRSSTFPTSRRRFDDSGGSGGNADEVIQGTEPATVEIDQGAVMATCSPTKRPHGLPVQLAADVQGPDGGWD